MTKKFKFTKEDLDNMVLAALEENQAKAQPDKPNILQLMRAKKELNQSKWPLV